MYSEVRVYDGEGKLKKIIPVQELQKRSDALFKTTLNSYLKSVGLPGHKKKLPPDRKKKKIVKICDICGEEFTHVREDVTICFSVECRKALLKANKIKFRDRARALSKINAENKLKI